MDSVVFKVIPIFGVIFLSMILVYSFFFNPFFDEGVNYPVILFFLRIIALGFCIFLIFRPFCFYAYSIVGFIFSVFWTVDSSNMLLSFLYILLFMTTASISGFFYRKRNLKVIIIAVIYILLPLAQLRLGKEAFFDYIVTCLFAIPVIFLSFIFIFSSFHTYYDKIRAFPLELNLYSDLTKEDIIIVCRILQNEKYTSISSSLKRSEVTIKKRAAKIFRCFSSVDKYDFVANFSNHPVMYNGKLLMDADRNETSYFAEVCKDVQGTIAKS